jgi:hypothetical protein
MFHQFKMLQAPTEAGRGQHGPWPHPMSGEKNNTSCIWPKPMEVMEPASRVVQMAVAARAIMILPCGAAATHILALPPHPCCHKAPPRFRSSLRVCLDACRYRAWLVPARLAHHGQASGMKGLLVWLPTCTRPGQ